MKFFISLIKSPLWVSEKDVSHLTLESKLSLLVMIIIELETFFSSRDGSEKINAIFSGINEQQKVEDREITCG